MLDRLSFWEMRAIIDGYRKRQQKQWEMTRWHAFMVMHNGMIDLQGAGVTRPADLVTFPWDEDVDDDEVTTPEDVEAMREMLRELNSKNKK